LIATNIKPKLTKISVNFYIFLLNTRTLKQKFISNHKNISCLFLGNLTRYTFCYTRCRLKRSKSMRGRGNLLNSVSRLHSIHSYLPTNNSFDCFWCMLYDKAAY